MVARLDDLDSVRTRRGAGRRGRTDHIIIGRVHRHLAEGAVGVVERLHTGLQSRQVALDGFERAGLGVEGRHLTLQVNFGLGVDL